MQNAHNLPRNKLNPEHQPHNQEELDVSYEPASLKTLNESVVDCKEFLCTQKILWFNRMSGSISLNTQTDTHQDLSVFVSSHFYKWPFLSLTVSSSFQVLSQNTLLLIHSVPTHISVHNCFLVFHPQISISLPNNIPSLFPPSPPPSWPLDVSLQYQSLIQMVSLSLTVPFFSHFIYT